MARLKERYQKEIAPAVAKEFGIKNPMAIPRLDKIIVNMGMGEAIANAKVLDTAVEELKAIVGQKPVITKAKKSIASFKLRQSGCTSFSIGWSRWLCRASEIFAGFRPGPLTAAATTRSESKSS